MLVKLAHSSKDLWTVNRIANALNKIAGVNFFPWDLQPLDKWWVENSSNYTNWPFAQYEQAVATFRACKYDEALTNFEAVLLIDPTADKSRALAVASAVEIGASNKAEKLNTRFAIKTGRWEQWAGAKMILITNATKGTEILASLAKKYPTFPGQSWIGEGNHILRQADWNLYSKLIQPASNSVSTLTNAAK